jgi:exonuclease VII small subunit
VTARPPPGDADNEIPVSELSYTKASRELDAIVEFFEQREVDVDLLVARLERATAIVDELDRRIRQTRMQVEELVPRLEAATRAATRPPPEAASAEPEDGELEVWEDTERGDDEDPGSDADSDSERPLF